MKKSIAIIIAILLVLSLAACGKKGESTKEAPAAQEFKLTTKDGKFEKDEYKIKKGESFTYVLAGDAETLEIKGTDVKLDKSNPKKAFKIENSGIYDVIGKNAAGKVSKSKIVID